MGTRTYGHDKTIHRNAELDIETDRHGVVVAVWFRCQPLPFKQHIADDRRSEEMLHVYAGGGIPALRAVEVDDI